MSFRRQLLLWIVPVLIVGVVATALFSMQSLQEIMLETARSEGVKQAQGTAWVLERSVWLAQVNDRNPREALQLALNSLVPSDEKIKLISEDYVVLYERGTGAMERTAVSLPEELMNGSRFEWQEERFILHVYQKVSLPQGAGMLVRSADLSKLNGTYKWYSAMVLFVSLLVMLLMIAALTVISGRLSKPLKQIIGQMQGIRSTRWDSEIAAEGSREVKLLASEFNDLMKRLDQENQQVRTERDIRQDFVDRLRHEMRTPLTSIVGYSDLLRRNVPDEEERAVVANAIYNQGKRLQGLSDALLYGLMAKGELEKQVVNAPQLVNDLNMTYAEKLEEKNLRLTHVGAGRYLANDLLLFQAIGNLVDNAVKASPTGGEIRLRFHDKGIDVEDDGEGFEADQRTGDMFFSQWKSGDGYGLGLHIVREIITAHDGQLLLGNHENGGARVQVILDNSMTSSGQTV